MPRSMFTSRRQAAQARHQALGIDRVMKSDRGQRFLGMGEQLLEFQARRRHVDRAGRSGYAGGQRHPYLVGEYLYRGRKVERRIVIVGRDVRQHIAAPQLLVGEARGLIAEHQRYRPSRRGRDECRRRSARIDRSRPEVARPRRGGNREHAIPERRIERIDADRVVQNVIGAAGARTRVTIDRASRRHQHHRCEAHGLDRAGGRADIPGVRSLDQYAADTGEQFLGGCHGRLKSALHVG